jgi:hypothetical protein
MKNVKLMSKREVLTQAQYNRHVMTKMASESTEKIAYLNTAEEDSFVSDDEPRLMPEGICGVSRSGGFEKLIPKLLDVRQTVYYLSFRSEAALRMSLSRGLIPKNLIVRIGSRIFFDREKLDRWLEEKAVVSNARAIYQNATGKEVDF